MRRKLVKQGSATMMISLPAEWVRSHGLDKGDEIIIDKKQGNLIISLEPTKIKRETSLNIKTTEEPLIRTIITNTYRLGYDTITINFSDKKTFEIIENLVENNLIGFEVISSDDSSCVIENITEPSKEQFNNIFSKILLNIDALFEFSEKTLSGEKEVFKKIEKTEKQITALDNFCRRVMVKDQGFTNAQLHWSFHTALTHGQRDLYNLLEHLNKNKIKPDPETLKLLKNCKDLYTLIKQAYLKKDPSVLEKIHETHNKQNLSLLTKSSNPVIAYYLLSSIRNFYLSYSPLSGILINVPQ